MVVMYREEDIRRKFVFFSLVAVGTGRKSTVTTNDLKTQTSITFFSIFFFILFFFAVALFFFLFIFVFELFSRSVLNLSSASCALTVYVYECEFNFFVALFWLFQLNLFCFIFSILFFWSFVLLLPNFISHWSLLHYKCLLLSCSKCFLYIILFFSLSPLWVSFYDFCWCFFARLFWRE